MEGGSAVKCLEHFLHDRSRSLCIHKSLWRYMVKPLESLVLVSSTPHNAYTPSLSTSWSWTALPALKEQGNLILKGASRLDAFSGYPVRT